MIKVGPAFFESISSEEVKTRRQNNSFFSKELIAFIPITLLVLIFIVFTVRLFYLQIIRAGYYSKLSDQNRVRTVLIPAQRGILLDVNGKALVSNSPTFKVIDKDKSKGNQIRWLEKDEALALISEGKMVEDDIQRNYLYKDAFAHVIGYVGQISEEQIHKEEFKDYGISDFMGKMGLEAEYEQILHGRNGKELYEVNAKGERVRFLGREEALPGKNLRITLDPKLQLATMQAMKDASKGAVVVTDPRDGAVRVLFSKPSFDPNLFTHTENYKAAGDYKTVESILHDIDNQPLLDRAISGTYPPGSTYKLITAAGALENGAITKETFFEDTGVLRVGAFSFGNWYFLQHGKKEGPLNVVGAIKRSNDIFFYKTAEELGISNLSAWSRKLGMGTTTNIDLPNEAKGVVPDPTWKKREIGESWYLGDTYNMGIGQGYLLSTPLQVNIWTMPFANNGTIYKPHLVDGEKKVLQKNFLENETRELVREGMRQSCETGGVAWPFFDFKVKNDRLKLDGKDFIESASGSSKMVHIKVGCKTGTAQTGGEKTLPHAWITVFAPFYNPEVVVTVLVENSGEGSSVAGPIAKKILERYFEEKN